MNIRFFTGAPHAVYLAFLLVLAVACRRDVGPYVKAEKSPTQVYNGNVIAYLESQTGQYDSMVAVIKKYPDLVARLEAGTPMTLFAIPNTAFAAAVKNFNNYRDKIDSPHLYLKITPYDPSRPDSGMFHYELLRQLVSRYIFDGMYTYDTLALSSSGYNIRSISGYEMNLTASQENTSGALKDGPKIIELNDMNYSIFKRYWKSVLTASVGSVIAGNVLVHNLSQNHEFGFASFTELLKNPVIPRVLWKAIDWHSQYTGPWGGTAAHAFDGDINTQWHTLFDYMPGYRPPPFYFTVDMGVEQTISGVGVQIRPDAYIPFVVTDFNIEFADNTVLNPLKTDSAQWIKLKYSYPPDPNTIHAPHVFMFPEKITARYFSFRALQNYSRTLYIPGGAQVGVSEVWFLY